MTHEAAKQEQVRRFYDCEAGSYDASRYESRRGRRRDRFHKELLCMMLDAPAKQDKGAARRVLEIGCGTGRFLQPLAQAGLLMTGTDLSEQMLNQAQARLEKAGLQEVTLIHSSALPFPDGAFSAAYSIFVVNLIPDYQTMFQGVARVLEPGGLFVFNVPNLTSCYWPFGAIINHRQQTSSANEVGARYSHWFSRREWRRGLERCGFQIDAVWGEPPWCGLLEHCAPLSGQPPAAWACKSLFIRARLDP